MMAKAAKMTEKAAETAATTVPMATTEISCVAVTCPGMVLK